MRSKAPALHPDCNRSTHSNVLSQDQRSAVMLLAHYFLAQPRGLRSKLFDAIIQHGWSNAVDFDRGMAKKDFDNFLSTGSRKGAQYIHDFFAERMANTAYYRSAPIHIQNLITAAFGFRPGEALAGSTFVETLENIVDNRPGSLERLILQYAGVWEVFRFSAHGSGDGYQSRDPHVVRSALQIMPTQIGGSAIFEMRSRPGNALIANPVKARGQIFLIGHGDHMKFFGWESRSRYPIDIFASLNGGLEMDESINAFLGLMIRRHENGDLFASRVAFLRSDAASLDAVAQENIGTVLLSELRRSFAADFPKHNLNDLVSAITNSVGSGGQSGLVL
jgi:hypothetical protein